MVIVASILLAFGIEAWWGERLEREEEQRLLVALLEESQDTLQQIERNVSFHTALIASANALLSAPLSPTATFPSDCGAYDWNVAAQELGRYVREHGTSANCLTRCSEYPACPTRWR